MRGKSLFSRRTRIVVPLLVVLIALVAVATIRWYSRGPRPNIILVTFDTTRADHLGAYGYDQGLTGGFDDFASRGVLFERAYAPCPVTLPSHATMLTGLYPPEHDLRVNGEKGLSTEIPFLPEILKTQGYDTGAFIAAAPVLGSQFGLNRGFDNYDDSPAKSSTRTRPYGGERRDGEEVVDLALDWLGLRTERPFFCWIHLYDAHGPYDSFKDIYQQKFEQNPYDAGVAWEIQQFDRVNSFLKDRQLDSNTLVIVAGDHGEGLDDHGEHEHGMLVYNSTLHVPLVFAGMPECLPGTRVANTVSLVDLMPTVLDILKIPAPDVISGRSLLPALNGQAIESRDYYAEAEMPYFLNRWCPLRSVISDRWKYIQSTRPELYNLEQDPGELTNLANSADNEREMFEILLAEIQDSFQRTRAEQVELSQQDMANLQSLGYVSGGTSSEDDEAFSSGKELIDVKDMVPLIAKFEEAKHIASGDRLEEAIALLTEVAEATDDFPMSDLRLGDLLAQAGRPEEATVIYRSVLARRPDFLSTHLTLGRILVVQDQFESAKTHFREFIKGNPRDAAGHFELAQVATRLQNFDEAILEYRESLRLAPESVPAHLALGHLLAMLRRPGEAVPYLEKALNGDSNNIAALENLMMVLAQTGKLDEAIQYGKRAVTLNPDSFETHFNLGLMLIQAQRQADGIHQLREAQRIRPDDPRPEQQIKQAESVQKTGR
jgi:arylsulfatase A-like enzyme/Flp pilus assembly protein TadD